VKPAATYSSATDAFLPLLGSPLSAVTLLVDIANNKYQNRELDPYFAKRYDEELGGIAVDPYNRLWLIDSKTNNLFLLSAIPNFTSAKSRYFKIQPWTNIGYLNDVENTFTYSVTAPAYKSAQATGDWTGNRWFQKYANFTDTIVGSSEFFNVRDFNNNFSFRKINESFNTSEYYKSLALPEILNKNTFLFDNFFGATVGTAAPSAYEDIGQKVYEKIANFNANHSDIDTCNVDQLLSLAETLNVDAINFSNVYPAEIQNVIDVTSIPRSRLWGLKNLTPLQQETIWQSRQQPLDPATTMITAGTQIFLQSIFDSKFRLTDVPFGNNNEYIYPLSAFPEYGLIAPVQYNYKFYEYVPVYDPNPFIESVIDWDSPFTTINRTISTSDELYKDGGIIEAMFDYYLTKNLIHN
jgi:hypothetical protein